MTTETPDLIFICFNKIKIYVPRTVADISLARKLLDMLDEDIREPQNKPQNEKSNQSICPYCGGEEKYPGAHVHVVPLRELMPGSSHTSFLYPQDDQTQRQLIESTPNTQDLASVPIQEVMDAPQIDAKPVNFFIPKFKWDKTKEKSYRTIFFFEHDDGSRVMIFYLNSRIFTTKEAVMILPYPVPYNYAPLRAIQNSKRTALKFYREYLAKQTEAEEARRQEVPNAVSEEEQKEAEAAKEVEDKRLEKLKQAAEVNKNRWAQKVKDEMPERTKELRKNIALKTVLGVGAEEQSL